MVKRELIRNSIIMSIIVLTTIFISVFYFSTYKVKPEDKNLLITDQESLLYNKRQRPKVNDFVVYEVNGKLYLSRLIAESGERVTSMDDVLYVNDAIKEEPYLEGLKNHYLTEENHQASFTDDFNIELISHSLQKTIPEGKYLLLNDNRQNTKDSREFGLINQSQIKGVAVFNLLPLNQFGFFDAQ